MEVLPPPSPSFRPPPHRSFYTNRRRVCVCVLYCIYFYIPEITIQSSPSPDALRWITLNMKIHVVWKLSFILAPSSFPFLLSMYFLQSLRFLSPVPYFLSPIPPPYHFHPLNSSRSLSLTLRPYISPFPRYFLILFPSSLLSHSNLSFPPTSTPLLSPPIPFLSILLNPYPSFTIFNFFL